MRQFEIGWANLPAPAGRRPIRAIPVEVKVGRREGLPSSCVANLDNVRTGARQWLDSVREL